MRDFLFDVRYALRGLRRNPGFALTAILALALGIGGTTAMFSVVDAALLRPLAYPEPDRLVWLGITFPSIQEEIMPGADYVEWSEQNRVFTGIAGIGGNTSCDVSGGEPERILCGRVTANFFDVTGIHPVLGRGFVEAEDQPRGPHAVVLSHGLWQRRFGGDSSALGKSLMIGSENHLIVGVMPAGFPFPGNVKVDALIPQQLDRAAQAPPLGVRILRTVARLRPGVSLAEARANVRNLLDHDRRRFPKVYREDNQIRLMPLQEHEAGRLRLTLLILLAAVCCVLLIACANVANLLLARSASRAREITVRKALGASRVRLARQLLTESSVLGAIGAAVGMLMVVPALRALVWMAPAEIPMVDRVGVNGSVLAFTFALAIGTGLLFGLAPVVVSGRSRGAFRSVLVVAELALSLMLVTGAALLVESLWKLQTAPLGFRSEQVLATTVNPQMANSIARARQVTFWNDLLERVSRVPGTEAVAIAGGLPPQDASGLATFLRDDAPPPEPGHRGDNVVIRPVSSEYFRVMGIPLRRGRLFSVRIPGAPEEVVVNEAMVRRYFANEDPIGKRIMQHKTIVGVVGDVKNRGLQNPALPEMNQAWQDARTLGAFQLLVRTVAAPEKLAPLLRGEIRVVAPDSPLTFRTLQDDVSTLTARPRFHTILLGSFALAALLLAAIGTYGVLSYMVAQRSPEIGIRMALGATPCQVVSLVTGHALRLACAGILTGVAGAWIADRYLASLLFGVGPNDPVILTGVSVLLAATALAASWAPARRATRVDPMIALRAE